MRNNIVSSETSLFGLIRHFREEIQTLFRQEMELAKAEMSEKFARLSRNAIILGVGGVAALAGLIIVLASLSSLLSFAFESAGMQRSLAFFIGAIIVGGVATLAGLGFVAKAARTFSKESLAPEKTLHTLQKIKPTVAGKHPEPSHPSSHPTKSSDEIEASIRTTQKEVGETADEITERLTPHHFGEVIKGKIQAHPLRSGLIAVGTGFLGSSMVARRFRHAKAA
jgi:hypothetical protein